MPSMTALVHQNQAQARTLERMRDASEQREEMGMSVVAFVATRVASKLIVTFVPSLAPMLPVIEIGGAVLMLKRAFDLGDDSGRDLGIALGLGTGAVDRVADSMLAALDKFKKKAA